MVYTSSIDELLQRLDGIEYDKAILDGCLNIRNEYADNSALWFDKNGEYISYGVSVCINNRWEKCYSETIKL